MPETHTQRRRRNLTKKPLSNLTKLGYAGFVMDQLLSIVGTFRVDERLFLDAQYPLQVG